MMCGVRGWDCFFPDSSSRPSLTLIIPPLAIVGRPVVGIMVNVSIQDIEDIRQVSLVLSRAARNGVGIGDALARQAGGVDARAVLGGDFMVGDVEGTPDDVIARHARMSRYTAVLSNEVGRDSEVFPIPDNLRFFQVWSDRKPSVAWGSINVFLVQPLTRDRRLSARYLASLFEHTWVRRASCTLFSWGSHRHSERTWQPNVFQLL